jgi:CO/xanthine dehydrogenase FAD-binding subunit
MTVVVPTSLEEALAALAAEPDAQALAGGTDFMVEVNDGRRRPSAVVSLGAVDVLRGWERVGDSVRLGASVTYTEMLEPGLAGLVPSLAHAARTVGSPQIRNAGTIGGNLATASPAGDTLPVLAALDAIVEVAGPSGAGQRDVPIGAFITGPKRTALEQGSLVVGVRVPVVAHGSQEYRKVGVRNAMVIAVASLALVVDADRRVVGCGLGSVGPVPLRALDAEQFLAEHIDWDRLAVEDPAVLDRFADLVSAAARPIDDHRSTAHYRRHAVRVLARRAAARALPGEAA